MVVVGTGAYASAYWLRAVDLIYIDPPFSTGDDFYFKVVVEDQDFTGEPNLIVQKAYRDTWGSGLD